MVDKARGRGRESVCVRKRDGGKLESRVEIIRVAETSGASDNTDKQPPLPGFLSDSAVGIVLIGERVLTPLA